MIKAVAKDTDVGVATLFRHQTPQLTPSPCEYLSSYFLCSLLIFHEGILVATPGLLESLEKKEFFSKTK